MNKVKEPAYPQFRKHGCAVAVGAHFQTSFFQQANVVCTFLIPSSDRSIVLPIGLLHSKRHSHLFLFLNGWKDKKGKERFKSR